MACELAVSRGPARDDRSLLHSGCRDRGSKSRWRPIPGAAFHDLLCDPASCRMPRHFNVEDFSVCESDDEEDVKRLEQDRRDAEKVASPNVRGMPRQEFSPRPGWAPAAIHSHIFGHGPGGNLKA